MPMLNWILSIAIMFFAFAQTSAQQPVRPSSDATVYEDSEAIAGRFGPPLAAKGSAILTQGAMDVACNDGWIYVLSRGRLCTFRTDGELASTPIGELQGLGNTRQIEIAGDLAAITSREDGLWLVDITDPAQPLLLSHYDTIELATGIALGPSLAMVACRQYGLELIDISDPRCPRHVSTFRTGEAQSVYYHDGLAYIGDWAPREVVVCDVRNPWRPALVSRLPLDGFGDGVFVRENLCFAATGHHSRAMRQRDPGDAEYGRGHGLEIFDVSDPKEPRFVARTKLPRLYSLGLDMWDVQVSGDFAVVGDTHNGLYVFDIRDPAHPVAAGYHRLPAAGSEKLPDAVGGFAIGRDTIYVAGARTGLHTLALPGIEPVPARALERGMFADSSPAAIEPPAFVAYRPEGQVHDVAVDEASGEIWVAAGTGGLHRVRLGDDNSGKQVAATEGVAFSVDIRDDLVALGEGTAGLSLWRVGNDGAELLGRYQSSVGGIGQIRISSDKQYAIVHAGPNVLEILDIRTPSQPRRVLSDVHTGLFYRTPFSHGFLPDGRFGCLWHVSGLFVFDLQGPAGPRFSGWSVPRRMDLGNGAAVCGERLLVVGNGGYSLLDPGQTEIADRDVVRLPGVDLRGKPSVFGDTLYLAQRWRGRIVAVDIADPEHPRLRWSLEIEGNPGVVKELSRQAIIPGGYDGVLVRPR